MKFGLLHAFGAPAASPFAVPVSGLHALIEQAKWAEEAGFHVVWTLEHRAGAEAAAAPELWLAAVAQLTRRIRIGHGPRRVPFAYESPIRVAEMAAVLDIQSGGRLELGTALPEPAMLGGDPGRAPSVAERQWDEALRMVPRMWRDEAFSWCSETFEMPPRDVSPKPLQRPHPPLWMTGEDARAAAYAGERGLGFLHLPGEESEATPDVVAAHRAGLDRADPVGVAVNDGFAASAALECRPDAREHRDVRSTLAPGARAAASRLDVVGDTASCRRAVEQYRDWGVGLLLFGVGAGAHDASDVAASIACFGREVAPHFDPDPSRT